MTDSNRHLSNFVTVLRCAVRSSHWIISPLHVHSKLLMTFFVKALRVRRALWIRSTLHSQGAAHTECIWLYNTSVPGPWESDAQACKLLHMLRRIMGSYGRDDALGPEVLHKHWEAEWGRAPSGRGPPPSPPHSKVQGKYCDTST